MTLGNEDKDVTMLACWKLIRKCFGRDDHVEDTSRKSGSVGGQSLTRKELVGHYQEPSGSGKQFDAFQDGVYMTGGIFDWRQVYEWVDTHIENSPVQKRKREDADAPNYGTVTMVRNGTRRMLIVYEEGKRELYVKVRRWGEVALPRGFHVSAKIVIESEDHLGQLFTLECVIDRLRNQDVIVTADDFVGWLVRVLDREDPSNPLSRLGE